MPIHIVSPGDTPSSLAATYGVSVSRLLYDNQLRAQDILVPGQALLVLIPSVTHTIAEGESLYSIAMEYDTTVKTLLRNNPYLFTTGYQPQNIPAGTTIVIRFKDEKLRTALFGGYAYPFIQPETLQESLLYLSELYTFSYGFTTEGKLVPTDDTFLLESAAAAGVSPILTLTPFDAAGAFNNYLVHILVENPQLQERLLGELASLMQAKGYRGIDLDFEYIQAEDKEGYAAFVARTTEYMRSLGYRTSVALAPKERADWPGLLYEGVDYPALGAAADQVLLMTYEWGYTYGPPMAIAPINRVRAVLDYAVTAIPTSKINLGVPNYAYDWPLPYERGITAASNISNVAAIRRAAAYGATIQFDETAQSPYYEYIQDGISHVVWFEDVRSIQAKLRLIPEYNLLGAVYWSLMKPFRANWLLLNSMFDIQQVFDYS